MEHQALENLRLLIQDGMRRIDPHARVEAHTRPDGKIDVTVISALFDEKDSEERESLFWPVLRAIPRDRMVEMTYTLLLTPEEAETYFGSPAHSGPNDPTT